MEKQVNMPTHMRFKNAKEAKHWGRTTKDWIPINEIQMNSTGGEILTVSFAWVGFDRIANDIEFAVMPYIICSAKGCDAIVEKKGELCEDCLEQQDDDDNDF